jgi:thymidylate synthase
MNNLDKQYQALLQDILDNGVKKEDRTGTGTISVFGRQIRHKMSEGFPLLTTKKMSWKSIVTELLWFLQGNTNIKWLVDNRCHIWDGDAYQAYIKRYNKGEYVGKTKLLENSKKNRTLTEPFTIEEFIDKIKTDDEFAKKWGELGPIYGAQWRSWVRKTTRVEKIVEPGVYETNIDQIQNLINDLKTNPDSRRLMVNAWNVSELDQMVLPPCHYGFQVYTSELSDLRRYNIWFNNNYETGMERLFDPKNLPDFDNPYYTPTPKRAISLMWNQRSVDTFLGLPFNIASYGLLLEIIAKEVNMVPDELIGNLGDVHLYSNHIEQAKEQIGRELSLTERREMVTQEMFNQIYNGGGPETLSHSEIDQWNISRKTREPFTLPKLSCLDEYWYLNDVELVGEIPFGEKIEKFRPDFFQMQDYQSHPAIKAPLSN